MKLNELRKKSISELKQEHVSLLREHLSLRFQKANNELKKTHELRRVRKDIARLLTLITEKVGESK